MKKFLGLFLAIGMICAIGGTASAACRGWDGWQLSVMDRFVAPSSHPNATARLTKCHCLPVDNYLYVGVRAQYNIGNNYYWNPGSSSYIEDDGSDINSVCASAYISDVGIIVYAKAHYEATCGTNATSSFDRTWTGDPGEAFGPVEE